MHVLWSRVQLELEKFPSYLLSTSISTPAPDHITPNHLSTQPSPASNHLSTQPSPAPYYHRPRLRVGLDLDFVSVKHWLRLRVSQMPDVDSASVQSRSSRMLSSRSLELLLPILIPSLNSESVAWESMNLRKFLFILLTFYLFYYFSRPLAIRSKGMSISVARNWLFTC